jgi:hypothetical protein
MQKLERTTFETPRAAEYVDAREAWPEELLSGGTKAPSDCSRCGFDVRPTVFEVDGILADEGEGVLS